MSPAIFRSRPETGSSSSGSRSPSAITCNAYTRSPAASKAIDWGPLTVRNGLGGSSVTASSTANSPTVAGGGTRFSRPFTQVSTPPVAAIAAPPPARRTALRLR